MLIFLLNIYTIDKDSIIENKSINIIDNELNNIPTKTPDKNIHIILFFIPYLTPKTMNGTGKIIKIIGKMYNPI